MTVSESEISASLRLACASCLCAAICAAFAADVAHRVLFLDEGTIVAEGPPDETVRNPSNERLKAFVSRFNH